MGQGRGGGGGLAADWPGHGPPGVERGRVSDIPFWMTVLAGLGGGTPTLGAGVLWGRELPPRFVLCHAFLRGIFLRCDIWRFLTSFYPLAAFRSEPPTSGLEERCGNLKNGRGVIHSELITYNNVLVTAVQVRLILLSQFVAHGPAINQICLL